ILQLRSGHCILRGAIWKTHPERLDRTRHGVRRIHPAARTGAGNRARFDLLQFAIAYTFVCVRADCFENRDDVERTIRLVRNRVRAFPEPRADELAGDAAW